MLFGALMNFGDFVEKVFRSYFRWIMNAGEYFDGFILSIYKYDVRYFARFPVSSKKLFKDAENPKSYFKLKVTVKVTSIYEMLH